MLYTEVNWEVYWETGKTTIYYISLHWDSEFYKLYQIQYLDVPRLVTCAMPEVLL